MTYKSPDFLVHAGRFTVQWLDHATASFRRALGLTLLPALPFLPRWQLQELTRFLSHAEPVMRRILYLMAAELGALPVRERTSPSAPTGAPSPARPAKAPRPLFPQPRFRLTEPEDRPEATRTPPPKRFRTGPRIRRFDVETPVDLSEYPAQPDDLLPSARQVRRLLALEDVFENMSRYVTALRRLIGKAQPILRRALPPAFRHRPLTPQQQQTACDFHAEAARLAFNTS